MKNIYNYIIEQTSLGKMPKQVAIDIIEILKRNETANKINMDIAIIGIDLKTSLADSPKQFWRNLRKGKDCIRNIPRLRKQDLDDYLKNHHNKELYQKTGYLEEIDKFDYSYFRLSPKEASLMDPNQRIFLEAAYAVINDAGQGKRIANTRTGLYVGFFPIGKKYQQLISEARSARLPESLSGNIEPMISGRISYLLDLKGPSMLVNTACSSSLVALHLACKSIQRGECDQAIAGGIKLNILPLKGSLDIGIESKDGYTRSFDDKADGTNWSEGAAAVFLKPLSRALADKDHIYAVIKGSAINHDGASAGLTAPNAAAQAEVIEAAWKDAGVDPKTISYIEAHGTGTKLGDPIEIKGLDKAFRKYTSENNICRIGSVKSNIGHTSEASGILGLIKTALALSGTNCHVILEEAPPIQSREEKRIPRLLLLSAKTEAALKTTLESYQNFLKEHRDINLVDLCYTAATGRDHHGYRLAIVIKNRKDLREKLSRLARTGPEEWKKNKNKDIYCASPQTKSGREQERPKLSALADSIVGGDASALRKLAGLYVEGVDPDWDRFYQNEDARKVSLPPYPFEKKRCWIEIPDIKEGGMNKEGGFIHPLLDKCLSRSPEQDVYVTEFSASRHFVLSDHRIGDKCILPGTAYIEMARVVGGIYYPGSQIELKNIIFTVPVILAENESLAVQMVIKKNKDYLEFTFMSQSDNTNISLDWTIHAKGKIYKIADTQTPSSRNINSLNKECSIDTMSADVIRQNINKNGFITFGPRWQNYYQLKIGKSTALAELSLSKEFVKDPDIYYLHPALLDMAIGMGYISRKRKKMDVLPLSYGDFRIYGPTSHKFYSYFRKIEDNLDQTGTISFDIELLDPSGRVFGEIRDCTLKSVANLRKLAEVNSRFLPDTLFHRLSWQKEPLNTPAVISENAGATLLLSGNDLFTRSLAKKLNDTSGKLITVSIGNAFRRITPSSYTIGHTQKDFDRLISSLGNEPIVRIIHAASLGTTPVNSLKTLEGSQDHGVMGLFYLTKALSRQISPKLPTSTDIILLSRQTETVDGRENRLNPENATMIGLGKAVNLENPRLKCRSIDIDSHTDIDNIIREINSPYTAYKTAYRRNERYIELLDELDLTALPEKNIPINKDHVYLITGGTGGLGLATAKYLAGKGKVKLVLIARSPLPPKKEWPGIISGTRKKEDGLVGKLKAITEIERTGSEVSVYAADVSEEKEITKTIKDIRKKYGGINGIIHAAGIAGDGFIIKKDVDTFKRVLAPKVTGTWLLDRLTRNDKLDFFVNFSSVMTIVSGRNVSDYTAANAYLNSFIQCQRSNKKINQALTVLWPNWKNTGLVRGLTIDEKKQLFKPISVASAVQILNFLFSKEIKHSYIVVGDFNCDSLIFSLGDYLPFNLSLNLKEKVRQHQERSNSTVAPQGSAPAPVSLRIKGRKRETDYTEAEEKIARIWQEVLGYGEIDVNDNFFEIGGDSLLIIQVHKKLEKIYPNRINIAELFTYPTITKLASYILSPRTESVSMTPASQPSAEARTGDIAIVGMSLKTSLALNAAEFWQNLKAGRDCVRDIPFSRKQDVDRYLDFKASRKEASYLKTGYLEEIDKFDYSYFRLSPKEASLMDPNQRLFLEAAYEAIDDAGQKNKLKLAKVGIYLGFSADNSYRYIISETDHGLLSQSLPGNLASVIPSRIAYFLDFHGPSLVTDCGCSSSLVSVHLACRSIRQGECDQAIAGGIKINVMPISGQGNIGIESKDGLTRSFDDNADGTNWKSEAVVAVFLKPLSRALEDKDHIYAVIKGSAINQDGASAGLTAPNAAAQAEVIEAAWKDAGVDPKTISYIEAHGTGTKLGDPIEIKGLDKAFRKYTSENNICRIGSVKSNIGHTSEASGILGLIKTALALKYKEIPPSIHFKEPNHKIDWDNSPVLVNTSLVPWKRKDEDTPLRAGISSFGLSGTNCHVILEEAPPIQSREEKRIPRLLLLSAKTEAALKTTLESYQNFLKVHRDINLVDLCYTAATDRDHHGYS